MWQRGQDSIVHTATHYRLDGLGFETWQREEVFCSPHAAIACYGKTFTLTDLVMNYLSIKNNKCSSDGNWIIYNHYKT
jgi:hypothetical protein